MSLDGSATSGRVARDDVAPPAHGDRRESPRREQHDRLAQPMMNDAARVRVREDVADRAHDNREIGDRDRRVVGESGVPSISSVATHGRLSASTPHS